MSPRKTKYIGGHMEVKTSIGFRALRHSVVERTIRKMNAIQSQEISGGLHGQQITHKVHRARTVIRWSTDYRRPLRRFIKHTTDQEAHIL